MHADRRAVDQEIPAARFRRPWAHCPAHERGDFAGARLMHHHIVPLMLGNFIESNPGPVKFAMAALGLCEEVFRLPMVSPRPASQEKIRAILKELKIEPAPVGAGD